MKYPLSTPGRETIRIKLPRSRPVTSAVEISQLSFPLFDVLSWWHKGDCRRRRCVECRSAVSLFHPRTTPSRVPECHRRCVVARPAVIKFPSRRGKLGNSNIWGILGGLLGWCRAWTSDFDKGTFLDVVLWIDGTPPSFFLFFGKVSEVSGKGRKSVEKSDSLGWFWEKWARDRGCVLHKRVRIVTWTWERERKRERVFV